MAAKSTTAIEPANEAPIGITEATPRALLERATTELRSAQQKLAAAREPIAIIGMGCRFPGGAHGTDAFWQVLRDGVDGVRAVTPDRWVVEPSLPEARWLGMLDEVDGFDADFFGIPPREAVSLDPQHRLLLEVASETLEDAGLPADSLMESRTGVYVGAMSNDYQDHLKAALDLDTFDVFTLIGNGHSFLTGRLSYTLGLQGPSFAVDTACSSSLVALHLACDALRGRQCDVALAGGVNLVLAPTVSYGLAKMRALAPDGRCKTFDARANGFVRGEGCGVVALKRLSDAQRDGDSIWAIVRGSAVNQDGRSSGLPAPNVLAQQMVIREALGRARVAPAQLGLVETHGTGTSLGDPIEIEALLAAVASSREDGSRCALGAVKTNFGHLESAAGIAGLIKAVLALYHRQIPPNLHFDTLNPRISLEGSPFYVPTQLLPWESSNGQPRFASVSSFGMSGTNAHVVLEEAPRPREIAPEAACERVLTLSARSPEALRDVASRSLAYLEATSDTPRDIAYTASVRRVHHPHRVAVVGRDVCEWKEGLQRFAAGELGGGIVADQATPGPRPKVAFVFPGHGSQWLGMGRSLLLSEPVFREAIVHCDEAIGRHADWSLEDELRADPASSLLDRNDVVQPMLFAMGVALAALWRSWGIEPDAVVGHSMGEIAAAHVAGALSLDDATRVICRRSHVLRRVIGRGAMAMVELPLADARAEISGREHLVSVAVNNSPRFCVLSGETETLEALLARLEQRGVFCRRVRVDYASHSPQMDPLQDELLAEFRGLAPKAGSIALYSTLEGRVLDGAECDGEYWVRNLREPVLFAAATEQLAADGHELFLEMSPNPLLLPSIREVLAAADRPGTAFASLRRDTDEGSVLLESLAGLHAYGLPVDWRRHFAQGGRSVRLPMYPWQHEPFWVKGRSSLNQGPRILHGTDGSVEVAHPLLAQHVESGLGDGLHVFETSLSTGAQPYLADHRVGEATIFPAAGYVELALAVAHECLGGESHRIEELRFETPLRVPGEDEASTLQVVFTPDGTKGGAFHVLSRGPESGPFVQHATGQLRRGDAAEPTPAAESLDVIAARCGEVHAGSELYTLLEAHGLFYGPSFTGLVEVQRRDGEALGRVTLPESVRAEGYLLHPALLDAAFHIVAACVPASEVEHGAVYVPAGLESFMCHGPVPRELYAHARLAAPRAADVEGELRVDVELRDDAGSVLATGCGLRLRRLDAARGATLDDWLYALEWVPRPLSFCRNEEGGEERNEQQSEGQSEDQSGAMWMVVGGGRTGDALGARLGEGGARVVRVSCAGDPATPRPDSELGLAGRDPGAIASWLRQDAPSRSRTIVWLEPLDAPDAEHAAVALETTARLLAWVQALATAGLRDAPRLYAVTRGAQPVQPERGADLRCELAPLWGLGKVIALEHPELRCTRIDLDPEGPVADQLAALATELLARDDEDQVAFRGGERFVQRLAHRAVDSSLGTTSPLAAASDRDFRLEIAGAGSLDRLSLREAPGRDPGPGEIRIEVRAAGLNFRDVLMALGVVASPFGDELPLGDECAGIVSAVGPRVEDYAVGDPVVALAPYCFARHVTVSTDFAAPMPAELDFVQAASVPVAFLTAEHALFRVGRLAEGESVLIHAAAGGVGQAAVQLAQRAGAIVFGTAGSEQKRQLLREQGVEHVFDSRTLDYADEILATTKGRGVDLVLNSLSGEAIEKNLAVLAPYGRHIEIGVRDIHEDRKLGLRPFVKSLTYSAVELEQFVYDHPAETRRLLASLLSRFGRGELEPSPLREFPIERAADAFRFVSQARHIGKVVLSLPEDPAQQAIAPAPFDGTLRADGRYVVVGGLGGLGLVLAEWLVERGARHLALFGRSAPGEATQVAIRALEERGARVDVRSVDVSDATALAEALTELRRSGPPLRGMIHSAMVLDDGILLNLDAARLATVFAPKVTGAWNLDRLTQDDPLDFFVLFSSLASLTGSPGQGNYTAANAFLDALAHRRRARGQPALAINWGPWAEVGAAIAHATRGERLASHGLASLSPEQGLAALDRLLCEGATQVGVMALDLRQWVELYPSAARIPLVSEFVRESQVASARSGLDSQLRRELLEAEDDSERLDLLAAYVRRQVGHVLGLPASKIDPHKPLTDMGLGSLVAVELRNRLESQLGLTLSATLIFSYPSLDTLVPRLGELLDFDWASVAASATSDEPEFDHLLDDLEALSEDELELELANEAPSKELQT